MIKTLLCIAAGIYLLIRTYANFRNPASDSSRFTPYALIIFAGLAFLMAFESYRNRLNGQPARERGAITPRLTRTERVVFKVLGVPVILGGLVLVSFGAWSGLDEWIKLARWPRTNATLVTKEISGATARLVFRYDLRGRQLTGVAFYWGSQTMLRTSLESYEPETIHTIAYDPKDPRRVEMVPRFYGEALRLPIFEFLFGMAWAIAGVVVYRWSLADRYADTNAKHSKQQEFGSPNATRTDNR